MTPNPPYGGRLKISLRAERTEAPSGAGQVRKRKFLDRCDLVSSRSRTETVRGMCARLLLECDEAERHLRVILDTAEEWVAALSAANELGAENVPEMTETQRAENYENCLEDWVNDGYNSRRRRGGNRSPQRRFAKTGKLRIIPQRG